MTRPYNAAQHNCNVSKLEHKVNRAKMATVKYNSLRNKLRRHALVVIMGCTELTRVAMFNVSDVQATIAMTDAIYKQVLLYSCNLQKC